MTSVRMSRLSVMAHSSGYSSMTEPLLVRLALLLAVLSVPSLHGTVLYRDTVMASTGQGVRAFLSHAAPGWEDCSVSDEANIAEVEWFAPAVAASAICNEMSSNLNCPVFKREFRDDPTGNLWPMERLAPCKLASLPYGSHRDNLVRFLRRLFSVQL